MYSNITCPAPRLDYCIAIYPWSNHTWLRRSCKARSVKMWLVRNILLHNEGQDTGKWAKKHLITLLQPGESGIGGLGNKKVTSKRDYMYQRLDGESSITCRREQVSGQSQVTWSSWLRHGPLTGRLFQIVLTTRNGNWVHVSGAGYSMFVRWYLHTDGRAVTLPIFIIDFILPSFIYFRRSVQDYTSIGYGNLYTRQGDESVIGDWATK